jgi:UDP-N-acetylmuramoyl-L-alanyl-D-glutamate--2,6-diaminopimelate ligase
MAAGMSVLGEASITGITADSRQVRPGYLFAALPGTRADGRAFIGEAVARGAAAVLTRDGIAWPPEVPTVPLVLAEEPRRALALMAARFHGAQPRDVAAVTGTNGKTSTVDFLRQIFAHAGRRAASIGTLGVIGPEGRISDSLTTPDPAALSAMLAQLAREGVDALAIEASSHGLAQFRLDGVRITAAAFTNLTRDHLDYHGGMAAYRAAKLRLFDELLGGEGEADGTAPSLSLPRPSAGEGTVRNHPSTVPSPALGRGRDREGAGQNPEALAIAHTSLDPDTLSALRTIAERRGFRLHLAGEGGDLAMLLSHTPLPDGQAITLRLDGQRSEILLPLAGKFQADNFLVAASLAVGLGVPAATVLAAAAHLHPVRGRMELAARLPNGAAIYVDYAHTPDALARLLAALRPHTQGRLILVFGAGGDRDPGKRPLMGEAAREADIAIVTDDNPRSESPVEIRRAVLAGCPGGIDGGERRAAIARALELARPGDVIAVAGKGHEQGQEIAGQLLPFDDVAVVRGLAR